MYNKLNAVTLSRDDIDNTLTFIAESLKCTCNQFGASAEAAGRALAEICSRLGAMSMDCTDNALIKKTIKDLDKILKDDDNNDNIFELEEQYRWEWLDDFDK